MRVTWTNAALADLRRVHGFLAPKNSKAAARAVEALTEAPTHLLLQPHIGQRLDSISGHEARRIVVGDYELRYYVLDEEIRVARIFHTRENR